MFSELNSILNACPENCPQGECILVSDRKADASFLIHHFLSFYLRAGCKVCFLGLVQSFSHYSAVGQRLGVSLAQARDKGQLVFLEGLKDALGILLQDGTRSGSHTLDFLSSPRSDLRRVFEFVQGSMSGSEVAEWGPPVLIVDDLTVLLSLGVRAGAVLDFAHYCRAFVCSKQQGNMVILVRGEDEAEDEGDEEGSEWLLKGLTHQCSLALRVEGLPTGYCKDIHGQVEVCWQGCSRGVGCPQRKLFQYKVHDKGASFFARGMSSAVL
ncbi:elongator complex protein 6 [Megalops cyprinoides]|uniref:elongator complex protein 6 n=1 Tax=Megalops cyprinoides TaxID=118141 RepID=UPI0018642389|nr:elongator complex protein 6 [Megalops cyprinoides]XP_036395426.1 elongator complex protein 6 [Megalops cyprinoides]